MSLSAVYHDVMAARLRVVNLQHGHCGSLTQRRAGNGMVFPTSSYAIGVDKDFWAFIFLLERV